VTGVKIAFEGDMTKKKRQSREQKLLDEVAPTTSARRPDNAAVIRPALVTQENKMATKDSMIIGCIENAERALLDAERHFSSASQDTVRQYHSGRIHALRDVLVGLLHLATYIDVAELPPGWEDRAVDRAKREGVL
jgi:hypothetical protein